MTVLQKPLLLQKMKNQNLFLLLLVSFSFCLTSYRQGRSSGCSPIIINKETFEKAKSAEFGILDATMYNYCLKVKVLHQSGCGKYKFNLVWDGLFPNTNPPGANIKINLTTSDTCADTKYETLLFDLSPMQWKRPATDTVIILALKGYAKPIRFRINQ